MRVTANYPGASAQTLENTVTQVIEQNMTGLDNLLVQESSQSSGTGQASVTLSFKAGTDPDEAVQQVQNQLQSAMEILQAVQNQGVTVRKTGDTNILTIAFVSTDGSMDNRILLIMLPVIFRTR